MSDRSAIEWTEATWNPVTGCDQVSPGCAHCYAKTFAERWRGIPGHPYEQGFDLRLWPARLEQPLRWRRPRTIFVNSMSDLFHELVPDEFIDDVFAVMAKTQRHTFQVLTKRPMRMLEYMRGRDWCDAANRLEDTLNGTREPLYLAGEIVPPLPNVWLGVSAENHHWAANRIPLLLQTPAAVRFVSAEPLLGPIDLTSLTIQVSEPIETPLSIDALSGPWGRLNLVIAGGESGPWCRPMAPAWPRMLRDQCFRAEVPFFFKQWGGRTPKSGGRELDGRTWDEMPSVA